MEPEEYVKMNRLEDRYWWFVGRRHLIETMMQDYVPVDGTYLDIGCGTGAMSKELAQHGSVVSLDFEHAALGYARQRGLTRLVQASAEELPFASRSFDAVTALDVVEHLDDDLGAAREIQRVLRTNGTAFITVPAFPFLWSEHDVALHHRRRYVADQLRDVFTQAGLEVKRVSYIMTFLYPAVAAMRLLQRASGSHLKTLEKAKTTLPGTPGPLNMALTALLKAEAEVVRRRDLPFGVSLLCVAQKQPQPLPRKIVVMGR